MEPHPDATQLRRFRAAAEEAAFAAGSLLRDLRSQPRQIRHKAHRDFVTDADIAAQRLIADRLRAEFPDHGFLAEEADASLPPTGPAIWVIDPVDGTTNYSRRVPFYSVSIAVMSAGGELLAGVVYDPERDELFSAGRGLGATRAGQSLTLPRNTPLLDAVVGFDWSRSDAAQNRLLAGLDRVRTHVHSIRAFGSAALALAWVAAGLLGGYLNTGCSAWDAAAGALLIAEAGGRVTAVDGNAWTTTSRGCLAGAPGVHDSLLTLLPPRSPTPQP